MLNEMNLDLETMEPKEFLRRAGAAERELKILKSMLDHFEDIGTSVSTAIGSLGRGQKGASRVELAAVGMADVEREIRAKMAEYSVIVKTAMKLISRVPQERYRKILTLHYLAGMSLPSVSDELGYSDRSSIYRALRWSIHEFSIVMQSPNKSL